MLNIAQKEITFENYDDYFNSINEFKSDIENYFK